MKCFLLALCCSLTASTFAGECNQARLSRDSYQEKIRHIQEAFNKVPNQQVASPISAQAKNQLDTIAFTEMSAQGIQPTGISSDGTFIRRLHLVLTGRLPEPETTRSFLSDPNPNKREALIAEVLESDAFVTHWSFWFQEMFQSTASTLRLGRDSYNAYLAEAVRTGKPLTQLATELLTGRGDTATTGTAAFAARAVDTARLSQDIWDNIAIHTSAKFLGVPLECISCHDGAYHLEDINLFLAERERKDLWGLAAFVSDIRIRPGTVTNNLLLSVRVQGTGNVGYDADTVEGDRPPRSGGLITPVYPFDGAEPLAGEQPGQALARLITTDRQFARNFANRLFGHMMGIALVEPVDGFDLYRVDPERDLPEGWELQSVHLELLEHLTDYLISVDYDFRRFLEYVAESALFQLDSAYHFPEWQEWMTPFYARYPARRLSAEAVYDSLIVAGGSGVEMQQFKLDRTPLEPAYYAHQLADVTSGRLTRYQDINTFLNAFGRGNRYDQPRTNQGNIPQALLMMNSDVVFQKMSADNGRVAAYLDSNLSLESVVSGLYLDVLCREPSSEETTAMLTTLNGFQGRQNQITTAFWLLVNKLEFLFVY